MSIRPILLAFLFLPACADPPTFVLAEGAATETSNTEPAADKGTPQTEAPANDDAGSAPATTDASAPNDAGKGKGKGKGDDD